MCLIYYKLFPRAFREVWEGKAQNEQHFSAFALLLALALFFLVTGLLPMWAALAVAAASVVAALIWAHRIQYGSGTLG